MSQQFFDISDAFTECCHNKIKAMYKDRQYILERHFIDGTRLEMYHFTLSVKLPHIHGCGSVYFTKWQGVYDYLQGHGIHPVDQIWLPLERTGEESNVTQSH